jgi:nucleoside phosphorylase
MMASQPNSGKTQEPDAAASRTLPATSYTVAWICALHIEMAAARAMLDEMHADLPTIEGDINNYALGSIGQHNVVIACLPEAQYGTSRAASVLTNLVRTFTSIRLGLMVGIGGGAPSTKVDVRLGDVVVGTRVMPYELGKVAGGGQIQLTAVHKIPDQLLCTLVSKLRANHEEDNSRMPKILEEKLATRPKYQHPELPDELFEATYDHDDSLEASMCDECDRARLVVRRERASKAPEVHYGGIASGDKVMRHGATRDDLARRLNAICFEMEAAGLMDVLPCLPIRGICDYSDTHKNKAWQRYAAATAAAYARELLEVLGISSAHYEPRNSELKRKEGLLWSVCEVPPVNLGR